MSRRIILHAGLHKTGTSSIQAFMGANREALAGLGFAYYEGMFSPVNHMELHVAAMRDGRPSPFKLRNAALQYGAAFRRQTADRIGEFAAAHADHHLVFSAEGLSYLRHPDEMQRLKELLPVTGAIEIVIYLRNRDDYAAAYRAEMRKHPLPAQAVAGSFADVADGSWLFDFGQRVTNFREGFGPGNVHVIDYDEACLSDGNVIPSFLQVLGLAAEFPASSYQSIWLNRRA